MPGQKKTIVDGAIYFDIEKDKLLQAEMAKEKAQLIQKMMASKSAGAATKKPAAPKSKIHSCEDETSGF